MDSTQTSSLAPTGGPDAAIAWYTSVHAKQVDVRAETERRIKVVDVACIRAIVHATYQSLLKQVPDALKSAAAIVPRPRAPDLSPQASCGWRPGDGCKPWSGKNANVLHVKLTQEMESVPPDCYFAADNAVHMYGPSLNDLATDAKAMCTEQLGARDGIPMHLMLKLTGNSDKTLELKATWFPCETKVCFDRTAGTWPVAAKAVPVTAPVSSQSTMGLASMPSIAQELDDSW